MAAIWGYVELFTSSNKSLPEISDIRVKMKNAMKRFPFDRIDELSDNSSYYFACGHQYYTPESVSEVLPYNDSDHRFVITADAVLDNRLELFDALSLQTDIEHKITDSELIRLAYIKWGKDCVKHLRGAYTVFIYDYQTQNVWAFDDHCGNRCVYYSMIDGHLLFSTLIRPILSVLPDSFHEYNEKWFAYCEAFYMTEMFYDDGSTPYTFIKMLAPGRTLFSDGTHIKTKQYWNPIKESRKKGILRGSIEDIRNTFVSTIESAVHDCLRSIDDTGITLSSGLDSSTVASLAARKLASEEKNLYSFTSVPLPDFDQTSEGYQVYNESEGIKPICKMYPNIVPTLVNCEGKSALTEFKHFVEMIEMPARSNINLVWIDDIYERASKQGIHIMLKGQFGNSTISYGTVLSCVFQLCEQGHFIRAYKSLRDFKRKMHVSKRKILSVIKGELTERKNLRKSLVERLNISETLERKYKIITKSVRTLLHSGGTIMDSRHQYEKFIFSDIVYEMLGMYDTKLGLERGIIVRDPTKDPRIIELCLRMPPDCFVHNGIERYGVRGFMKDIVPAEVRNDISHRGVQSADLVFRIQKALSYPPYKQMVLKYLNKQTLSGIIALAKRETLCEKVNAEKLKYNDVIDLVNYLTLAEFLERY